MKNFLYLALTIGVLACSSEDYPQTYAFDGLSLHESKVFVLDDQLNPVDVTSNLDFDLEAYNNYLIEGFESEIDEEFNSFEITVDSETTGTLSNVVWGESTMIEFNANNGEITGDEIEDIFYKFYDGGNILGFCAEMAQYELGQNTHPSPTVLLEFNTCDENNESLADKTLRYISTSYSLPGDSIYIADCSIDFRKK